VSDAALEKLHVHLENSRKRSALFHLTEEKWAAAAQRHRKLAKNLRVTIGWDGDIIDDTLRTADVMINSNPPRDKLRERAPRLKWIQTTGAGVAPLKEVIRDLMRMGMDVARLNFSHGTHAEHARRSVRDHVEGDPERDTAPPAPVRRSTRSPPFGPGA